MSLGSMMTNKTRLSQSDGEKENQSWIDRSFQYSMTNSIGFFLNYVFTFQSSNVNTAKSLILLMIYFIDYWIGNTSKKTNDASEELGPSKLPAGGVPCSRGDWHDADVDEISILEKYWSGLAWD